MRPKVALEFSLIALWSVYGKALSNKPSTYPAPTFRVCQGSGCLSKCRGSFDPKKILERLTDESDTDFEIEETFCMNQCKRGPNIRMIRNGQVLTFEDEGVMNDTEKKRKTFQNVANEKRLEGIWGLGEGVADGTIEATESGAIEKLSDIMPIL